MIIFYNIGSYLPVTVIIKEGISNWLGSSDLLKFGVTKLLPLLFPLALFTIGCGGNKEGITSSKLGEDVTEAEPQLDGVTEEETEELKGKLYVKGSSAPYTGKFFSFYQSGHKKSEEDYDNGKSHGLKIFWYKDGKIRQKMNYKNGKLHGSNVMWLNNGQKYFEINSKKGRRDGVNIYWFTNGQKRREENYENGKEEGLFTRWHENGEKLMEVNFKNGDQVSEKYWNSKGKPVDSYEESFKE